MPMSVAYLTPEGFQKLQQELDYLRTVRRKEVAERLREALDGGDRGIDMDAEYDAARNEQAFVEGRIDELERILANARLIDTPTDNGVVHVGNTVIIQEEGYEPETYVIVGAAEADPGVGRISNESPLGMALLGHKPGESVTVHAPAGEFTVKILEIK
ncbi:MAG: transcription elongation factor GreA [Anaerolineae bacterium]|nr:MAG: transcription elongation factor GreA [Anaerolineae bacterium]